MREPRRDTTSAAARDTCRKLLYRLGLKHAQRSVNDFQGRYSLFAQSRTGSSLLCQWAIPSSLSAGACFRSRHHVRLRTPGTNENALAGSSDPAAMRRAERDRTIPLSKRKKVILEVAAAAQSTISDRGHLARIIARAVTRMLTTAAAHLGACGPEQARCGHSDARGPQNH